MHQSWSDLLVITLKGPHHDMDHVLTTSEAEGQISSLWTPLLFTEIWEAEDQIRQQQVFFPDYDFHVTTLDMAINLPLFNEQSED